ncbi:MAG: LapA family protein [Pseudomonadales bacterium]|nr:LapA family protein [Pseudomonadales bacterium]MDG1443359.1 LapA family protein [Pseudomonadales bacterium]
MKLFKSLIFKLVAVIIFILVVLVASENSEKVILSFLDYDSVAWPVSWWMMTAFLSGVIVASVWNLWTNSALRLAVRKANKRSDKTNQSLDQVRAVKTPGTTTEPAPSATDSAESALQRASSTDLVKS